MTFGHMCSAVPEHNHGLLGWIYEVQSRHLKPLVDEAIFEVHQGIVKSAAAAHVVGKAVTGSLSQLERAATGRPPRRKSQHESSDEDGDRGAAREESRLKLKSSTTIVEEPEDDAVEILQNEEEDNEFKVDQVAPDQEGDAPMPARAKASHRRRDRANRMEAQGESEVK